jgi:4-amino-4-deoxy-L-arabinose transferase-like glycosyltransferase
MVGKEAPSCSQPAFLSWLPYLWAHVLFPGSAADAARVNRRTLLLLLILPGLLLYPCMSFYLFEPDEGRYAQIPREMLTRGEWIVPTLQGEPYLDKPPLFYWLVMGSFAVFGFHDWAARLVTALAVHGTILLTYLFGRRSLGERPAAWGALTLALAPGFIGMGRLLVLDGVLSFWVALSLFAAFEAVRTTIFRGGWWLLAGLACGLGVLTKGPVALILFLPPLWLYRWLTPGTALLSRWAWFMLFGIVLAVALPWYVVVCCTLPEFAGYFFWEHNVVRFLGDMAHQRPVWYFVPILFLGLLPTTLLLIPYFRFLFSGQADNARQRTPESGFMLLAGGWCVVFFSLSSCKLPTYILPAFPFLGLAIGSYLAQSRWRRSRWTLAVCAGTVTLLVVGNYFVVPEMARLRSPMSDPEIVRAHCADRAVPVRCYPRNLDSVAFYLGRDDLRSYRSKQAHLLIQELLEQPATVVLFSHRHSLQGLSGMLPPALRVSWAAPLGLCDMAVIERR